MVNWDVMLCTEEPTLLFICCTTHCCMPKKPDINMYSPLWEGQIVC